MRFGKSIKTLIYSLCLEYEKQIALRSMVLKDANLLEKTLQLWRLQILMLI